MRRIFLSAFLIIIYFSARGQDILGWDNRDFKVVESSMVKDSSGQSNCLEKVIYETASYGDEKESFPYALKFIIQNDSLRIESNEKDAKPDDIDLFFKITEKSCTWNKDCTEGQSIYKLLTEVDKGIIEYPTLTVVIKEKRGQLVLQYQNQEPRIFSILINDK